LSYRVLQDTAVKRSFKVIDTYDAKNDKEEERDENHIENTRQCLQKSMYGYLQQRVSSDEAQGSHHSDQAEDLYDFKVDSSEA
jgi:hypothetical protein